jgi:TRAP transporter 4TM/12TM fusion protein
VGDNTEQTADEPVSWVLKILRPILAVGLTAASLAWSADLFRAIGLNVLNEQIMAPMLGSGIALVFIHFPARRKTKRTRVPWYDGLAAIAGFVSGWYVGLIFPDLIERLVFTPVDGIITATIFYILCLEGMRRSSGYALFLVVIVFSIYALFGHLAPGDLQTRDVAIPRLISYLGLDTNALMGFGLKITATIVFTFIFFGQLLLKSGGSAFFSDFSLALMGRFRGGSAKISITASSLFGSVSGIVISNIVATGVVTIPLMKRNGFPARLAGAIEAVASTGGQLMPPVMGVTAFLMADFLARPYKDIVLAALVPSLLYYVALFIQADLEAAKRGISRIEEKLIPAFWPVMKRGGMFFAPFAVLIYALFWLNWEVQTAAILASFTVIFIGMVFGYRGVRMKVSDIYDSFHVTGISVLDILMIIAGASFIIGILQITGLGFAFTVLLVKVGGGSLFMLLLFASILCIVLGMGMPTLAVYVLLAAIIAPALVEAGIPPLSAHMFILYLGMMSFLTPPVAIGAFFAASLAEAPPMATAWTSMRFGWTAYAVPFMFVFAPALLLQNPDVWVTIVTVSTAIAGVWLVSAAMIGYLLRHMGLPMRAGLFAAGVLLTIPGEIGPWAVWSDAAGVVLGGLLIVLEFVAARRAKSGSSLGHRRGS